MRQPDWQNSSPPLLQLFLANPAPTSLTPYQPFYISLPTFPTGQKGLPFTNGLYTYTSYTLTHMTTMKNLHGNVTVSYMYKPIYLTGFFKSFSLKCVHGSQFHVWGKTTIFCIKSVTYFQTCDKLYVLLVDMRSATSLQQANSQRRNSVSLLTPTPQKHQELGSTSMLRQNPFPRAVLNSHA